MRQKVQFQAAKLLVEQIVGLVDLTNQGVGGNFGRTAFNTGQKKPLEPASKTGSGGLTQDLLFLLLHSIPTSRINT
jgi:hypothetical protein